MLEPEKVVSSEIMYLGSRVNVRRDVISLPDGRLTSRDVVEHPDAVSIVAIDGDRKVLLVKQYRRATNDFMLEVPAGVIDSNEEPIDAAQRELREETGYQAESLGFLGSFYAAPGILTERMHAFLATGLTENPLPADEDENIQVQRIPLTDAFEMASTGVLIDAKSIVSLLFTKNILES